MEFQEKFKLVVPIQKKKGNRKSKEASRLRKSSNSYFLPNENSLVEVSPTAEGIEIKDLTFSLYGKNVERFPFLFKKKKDKDGNIVILPRTKLPNSRNSSLKKLIISVEMVKNGSFSRGLEVLQEEEEYRIENHPSMITLSHKELRFSFEEEKTSFCNLEEGDKFFFQGLEYLKIYPILSPASDKDDRLRKSSRFHERSINCVPTGGSLFEGSFLGNGCKVKEVK